MQVLTDQEILQDIENFQKRIQVAQAALATMPETAPSYKGRNKLDAKRRLLQDEIMHVQRLISYAKEALSTK